MNPLKKLTSSRTTEFEQMLLWNISQMITKHPVQCGNSHKLCNEAENYLLSLTESQWRTSEFPSGGKTIVESIVAQNGSKK